ncbi:hypothetical protein [Mesorhizobium helmanticense]|nr:hypothetical protein [Mesorhizobium helmanticense]
MTDERDKASNDANDFVVRRLVKETGITEGQAIELVGFLGPHNWSSLVREAHLLKKP